MVNHSKMLFCVVFFIEMKAILLCKTKDIHLLMFCKTVKIRNFFLSSLLTPVVLVLVNWNYVGLS